MSWLDYVFGNQQAAPNPFLQSPELRGRSGWTMLPAKGRLQARTPSMHEEIVQAINEHLYGGKPLGQTQAEFVGNIASLTPQVAAAEGAEQAMRGLTAGDPYATSLGLAAVTPVGKPAKALETIAKAAKVGRAPIASASIRELTPAEALVRAKAEPHLKQSSEGQYIGAPRGVKTRAQINTMRRNFDKLVDEGAQGGDWYTRAGQWIRRVSGNDPAKINRLSGELALTSAQADPATNLAFTLQGHNALALTGKTPPIVRTGAQAREMQKSWDTGQPIHLGAKTGIYEQHMNPLKQGGPTGTNDIWHARAFGYTNTGGTEFSRALTAAEHNFLDHETVLAAERANQRRAGGRTDWTAAEVQAAPWVAAKGRGLQQRFPKRYPTTEAGRAEAAKTYPDYAPAYTAEAPGQPGFRSPTGNDVLYSAANLYNEPTVRQGAADVARPLFAPLEGGVHPRDQAAMNAIEAARGYASGTGQGRWQALFPKAPKSRQVVKGEVNLPMGAGRATTQLEGLLSDPQIPQLLSSLDRDPAIRQVMRDLPKQGVSKDVLKARSIIAKDGFLGLFAALKRGEVLPAAAAAVLGAGALSQQDQAPRNQMAGS